MLTVSSSTGGMSVIASGLGITYGSGSDYTLKLKFDDGFSFEVRFEFRKDSTVAGAEMRKTVDESARRIRIECINAEDFIGTGTTSPNELAVYKGRKVYINFWIRTPESELQREVRYCIYMEDGGSE